MTSRTHLTKLAAATIPTALFLLGGFVTMPTGSAWDCQGDICSLDICPDGSTMSSNEDLCGLDVCNPIGTQELPGHGDTVILWTPLIVANSPFLGKAQTTDTKTFETKFVFGETHALALSGEESSTLSAVGGDSLARYMLLRWRHIHATAGGGYCEEPVHTEDKWYVSNYAPTGSRVVRPAALTGGSAATDADNLAKPVFTGWEADYDSIAIDVRYKEDGNNYDWCTLPGQQSDSRTISSTLYQDVTVSFSYKGVAIIGTSRVDTQTDSYTYSLPGGHCWRIHHPTGPGTQVAFEYAGPHHPGRITHLEWHSPRLVGCDALDLVENALGAPVDTGDYTVHMVSEDGEKGVLKVQPRGSRIVGIADYSGFETTWVDNLGLDSSANGEFDRAEQGVNLHVDARLTTRVDYEMDPTAFSFTVDGDGDYLLEFGAVTKGNHVDLSLLGSTMPPEYTKGSDAQVWASDIANAGSFLAAIRNAFIEDSYQGEFIPLDVHCSASATAPSTVSEHQSWVAVGTLSTTGVLMDARVDTTEVRVDFDLA